MHDPDPPPVPITLLLPDGQEIGRVRLHERQQLDSGLWMYRIGVPMWTTAVGGGVEPADYETWVTADQLRPIPGVNLEAIPTHHRSATAARRWAWLMEGRTRGRPATVHDAGCRLATDRATSLDTMTALTALARPGTTACTACDAAEVLLPILRHAQHVSTDDEP